MRYDPLTDHSAYTRTMSRADSPPIASGPQRARIDPAHADGRRLRLVVSVVGITGFIVLIGVAHFAGGLQKPVQAAALIWFLVFGVTRFGLDLTRL